MIKCWLIKASAPVCGTDAYYRAYSKENPEDLEGWDEIYDEIVQDLWDDYSWTLHLEDEEYSSEEEEQEAHDQAWEDWRYDCNVYVVKEATEEDLYSVAPAGKIECIDIIYDERN